MIILTNNILAQFYFSLFLLSNIKQVEYILSISSIEII